MLAARVEVAMELFERALASGGVKIRCTWSRCLGGRESHEKAARVAECGRIMHLADPLGRHGRPLYLAIIRQLGRNAPWAVTAHPCLGGCVLRIAVIIKLAAISSNDRQEMEFDTWEK